MFLYAATISISAFLLFQVQPMIARMILPWFGGGAAVWITCMLFFQVGLLAGYAYSHSSIRFLSPRSQAFVHILLLIISLLLLPVMPDAGLKPPEVHHPLGRILWLLLTSHEDLSENPFFRGQGAALQARPGIRAWSDDYSNLFQILK